MTQQRKYGLLISDLNDVVSIIQNNSKIFQVILFGSRAKGSYREGSDVDIALKGDCLKLTDVLDASIEIDNLDLPYKFDLIIYDRINERALLKHIDRVGVVLFNR